MIKRFIHIFAISSILLAACATPKTAQRIDQNDDVYYSEARAKEAAAIVVSEQPIKKEKSDYVTEQELYADDYRGDIYVRDYTSRIYRFRNYYPSLGYYNSIYGYNYDPFYGDSFYPYSYYGSPGLNINIGIGNGYYNNYNPWRYYGSNYRSNYWGPYSYYNTMNPYGYGYGGYYGNAYDRPVYSSPNLRPRPNRTGDNMIIDRGSVIDNRNGTNGNVIQSRGRSERYGDNTSTAPRSSGTRTQAAPARPERVSQTPPSRDLTPERVSTMPRQDSGSQQSGSGGRSSDETGGARPSRGN